MLELLVGVLVGIFVLLAAEAVAVFAVLARVLRKKKDAPPGEPSIDRDEESIPGYDYRKKGIIWLLDPEKISKTTDELKSKKRVIEVSPSRKYAKIIDRSLFIMDADGRQEEASVRLTECVVLSVSGSDLPSKKWAKKYPIRVEGKRSTIYKGSQVFYLFLETSMEKESWCKALRQASSEDTEKLYAKLRKDFSDYASEFVSFSKPSETFGDVVEKTLRVDSSSKVRQLFKKMTKKTSKSVNKVGETALLEKNSSCSSENSANFVAPVFDHFGSQSQSQIGGSCDAVSSEGYNINDGRCCWNLLFSRLFFDAQRSARVNSSIKERIQKSLSHMRTPNYIGGITCTSINLGNLPPYICSMRVLPMDEDLEWGFEANIEYYGGISLEIETRLDVGESDFREGFLDSKNADSNVTSALLGDLEEQDQFLNLASDFSEKSVNKLNENRQDSVGRSKSTSWATRYKSLVSSIAEHVSQVPLSLSLKITSLRGNLRVVIKPPPSDQLWFGFTSTPELEWSLDASVGDCKLGSGHVTSLIGNRIKTAIQETLVLPNSESVAVSWMLAEKDDWLPRHVAPFIWVSRRSESAGGAPAEVVPPPLVRRDLPAETTAGPLVRRYSPASIPGSFSGESAGEDSPAGEGWKPPPATSPARIGRKARMLDLGRKMSEKLEEKRRHIEEKGRLMVEKMIENVEKRA